MHEQKYTYTPTGKLLRGEFGILQAGIAASKRAQDTKLTTMVHVCVNGSPRPSDLFAEQLYTTHHATPHTTPRTLQTTHHKPTPQRAQIL